MSSLAGEDLVDWLRGTPERLERAALVRPLRRLANASLLVMDIIGDLPSKFDNSYPNLENFHVTNGEFGAVPLTKTGQYNILLGTTGRTQEMCIRPGGQGAIAGAVARPVFFLIIS